MAQENSVISRSKLAVFGTVLLAMFMVALVWANYASQRDLRDASLKQFHANAGREASAFFHFLSERKNNLEDLASSRELLSYYENRALGMSKEYGLWASLVGIAELFERTIHDKVLQDINIFKRIVYLETSGEILADDRGVIDSNRPWDGKSLSPYSDCRKPDLFVEWNEGHADVILVQPYLFKGEQVGAIVAWINTQTILSLFLNQTNSSQDEPLNGEAFIVYGRDIFSPSSNLPDWLSSLARSGMLPKPGEVSEARHSWSQEKSVPVLITSAVIEESPLMLLYVAPRRNVFGFMTPSLMLLSTLVFAVLLLGGGGLILIMGARNLVLNVQVAESAKHSRLIELKNEELERQVTARTKAEEALQLVNEELELRVQQRTSALNEQAKALLKEVSERREAEEALRLIFNNTHDAIIIHDGQGNILDVNERMLELFQVERSEVPALSVMKDLSCPTNNFEELSTRWKSALEGQRLSFDWIVRRPHDGGCFDVEVALSRIDIEGRGVILANMHDMSAQKKTLLQQAEHQAFLNTVFEGIGAAIIVFDPTQNVMVDCNRVSERLLAMTKQQLFEDTCVADYTLQGEGGDKLLLCPDLKDKGTYEEYVLILPDGSSRPVSRHLFEVFLDGRAHLVQVVFDITSRKNLERKLSIAHKMESIGSMAAGIAHEINTPIQYIGDNVRFFQTAFQEIDSLLGQYENAVASSSEQDKAALDRHKAIVQSKEDMDFDFLIEEIPHACQAALEGVERVATIVLAMKNFTHPGDAETKPTDINMAIENTITVTRNAWKYVAEMQTVLAPDLPEVHCQPDSINQVLLNVIVNAAHALTTDESLREKGKITVSTTYDATSVEIRIEDTGCGIPEENIHKIFDPFFTTKEVGKGTGQGLAIVHDIVVNKHGGSIDVESTPEKGTTFTISLPINPK